MNVLQIVADGTPGGGTTNVLALTEDLIDQGVGVTFCSQRDSYAIAQATALGANVVNQIDFFRSRLDRTVVSDLTKAVASHDPQIVHVHGGRAALALVRSADSQRLRRTIYTVRGYHFYRKPQPLRLLAKKAERKISQSVFRTVHVCQDDQTSALKHGLIPDRGYSQVIRNGIRLDDIPIPPTNGDRKHVAVLGRLTYQKNPELVLEIAKVLSDEGYIFHLIGGGDLLNKIRHQVDRERITNVHLHGEKSRADALRLMASTGTFLLASRWEGLPIAPVEAMAMGLAVVISDVNGNTEVVRDGKEGRVAPSDDLDAFTRCLRAVVSESGQTDTCILNGKQRVANCFTRQRVIAQHLQLYDQCLVESNGH